MKTLLKFIMVLLPIIIFSIVIVKSVRMDQNCTGYLERASNANTVETATQELNKALLYLEENNLTSGYTSILWKTPDEDIEYWYNNLVASRDELLKVTNETTALEKTNVLMKLRETLTTDKGESGTQLVYPEGISRYPSNGFFAFMMVIAFVSLIVCIFLIIGDF